MKNKRILCTIAFSMMMYQGLLSYTAHAQQTSTQIVSTHRLAGENRYDTSISISQSGWTKSDTVILASGDKFADALCAGPLAKKYNAPILLIPTSIGDNTLNELTRLQAKNIILVGGTGAVSRDAEKQLKSAGYANIDRIGGKDRYETSAIIAKRLDKTDKVVIVSGENFPDALSISTIASKLGMPILLSNRQELSGDAKQFIESNGIKQTYIVGGEGVLSTAIEQSVPSPTRLGGKDRYGTNLAVIKQFDKFFNFDNIYLALGDGRSGDEFADALSGAALACNTSSPILITNQYIDEEVNTYVKSKLNFNTKAIALGGQAVVPDTLIKTVMDEKAIVTVAKIYDKAGTYSDGEINGSVTISAADVKLKNTSIKGDLLIASTVNDGNVDLDNVTVTGKTIINGGGAHSVNYQNVNAQKINLDKPLGEETRIVIGENASIDSILVESNGVIDQSKAIKPGNVTVEKNADLKLIGKFDNIEIKGQDSKINIENASIKILKVMDSAKNSIINVTEKSVVQTIYVKSNAVITGEGQINKIAVEAENLKIAVEAKRIDSLEVTQKAKGTVINVAENSKINTLTLNAAANIKGTGKIENATVNVEGSILEKNPTNLNISSGVSVVVDKKIETGKTLTDNNTNSNKDDNSEVSNEGGSTEERPQSSRIIANAETINDINVANGTTLSAIVLPSNVNITLSDNTTTSAAVSWDGGSPSYNGNMEGSYEFTGTITLPTGVTNPNNINSVVKVKVAAQIVQEKTIRSVDAINDINVANGTTLSAIVLPSSVNITLSDNTTTSAVVSWDGGSPSYNGNTEGSYEFTGIITLPSGIINPNNKKSVVKVKVAAPAPVVQEKTIRSVDTINDINVANGTAIDAIVLPSNVNITLSDNTTTSAAVSWDGGSPSYNSNTEGSYEFTGIITLPSGITNPNNIKSVVKVKVAAPIVQEKTIRSVDTINDINVANGTAIDAIVLPSNVNITLSDNTTTSAVVSWDGGSPSYNGNTEGSYEFTGIITLPSGITNPNNTKSVVKVKVAAPIVQEKTIRSVDAINDINVANRTAIDAIVLPSNVNITLSDNTTTSAAISWDGGSPSYNGNTEGSYEFTGIITLSSGITNPNNIKSVVKVKVAAPIIASGMTVAVAAKSTPVDGIIILTVTPGATDGNHKVYYRVVDAEPTAMNVGHAIMVTDWIEVSDTNANEISVVDGKYIEAVDVTSVDSKITKWGKSIVTNDGYVVPVVVTITSDSVVGATAGNSKIMGLTSGMVYKVTTGTTTMYTKADGTLTANEVEKAALGAGITEITGLTNGTTYEVSVVNVLPTKIYWVNYENRQILKSNLDGSNIVVVLKDDMIAMPGDGPVDIAVDNVGGKMYWRTGKEIRKANLDGSGLQIIVNNILSHKGGFALDEAGNKLYFGIACTSDGVADSKICSVDLNNLTLNTIGQGIDVSNVSVWNEGIMDLELNDGKLYWSTSNGFVKKSDLNGGNITIIADTSSKGNWINGIAVDSVTSSIYWIASNANNLSERKIVKADLINFIQTDVVNEPSMNMVDEYDNPMHIAIGGGSVYWTTNYSKLFRYDGMTVIENPIPESNGIPGIYQDGGITLSLEN